MKKLFALVIACIYLGSAIGANIHLHYCMDKLINRTVLNDDGTVCANCGMEEDGGCCKDEHHFIKNANDQRIAETGIQFLKTSSASVPIHFFSMDQLPGQETGKPVLINPPPLPIYREIYIRNCVFRI